MALPVWRTPAYGASGPQSPGDIRRLIRTWLATSVVREVVCGRSLRSVGRRCAYRDGEIAQPQRVARVSRYCFLNRVRTDITQRDFPTTRRMQGRRSLFFQRCAPELRHTDMNRVLLTVSPVAKSSVLVDGRPDATALEHHRFWSATSHLVMLASDFDIHMYSEGFRLCVRRSTF